MKDDVQFDREQAFMAAVHDAISQQWPQTFFTAAEQMEMAQPFHEEHDYFHVSFMSGDGAAEDGLDLTARIFVEDPRIPADRVANNSLAAITLVFEGKDYHLALPVVKPREGDVAAWQSQMDVKYKAREGAAIVTLALRQAFGLAAGEKFQQNDDFYIGAGVAGKVPSINIQLFTAAARAREKEIQKFAENTLSQAKPGQPYIVRTLGPIIAAGA